MNLLSVAAAYGVLVAIFQYGWIDGFLGFESLGYINTMTPPFLLAIVFGLSMDYEVFLLSRIRERYDATGDTTAAVAQGLRQQRGHDLERRADHGRGVRGLRRHRRAVDQGDRRRAVGGDRARRDARAARAGARHDGAHGPLELVAAAAAGAGPATRLVRGVGRGPRPSARRPRRRRRARRWSARKSSRWGQVVSRADMPVSAPRWPPGTVSSRTDAAFSSSSPTWCTAGCGASTSPLPAIASTGSRTSRRSIVWSVSCDLPVGEVVDAEEGVVELAERAAGVGEHVRHVVVDGLHLRDRLAVVEVARRGTAVA